MAGYVCLEEARLMGRCRIEAADARTGNDLRCRPVGAGKVQTRVFIAARTWQFSIRDFCLIIVVGHIEADLMPIVERLGSRRGH